MNTFAYIHKNVKHGYQNNRLSKYIKHNGILDIIKVGGLSVVLLFIIVVYLYYVTLASTRGYFLRQANQEHNSIQFTYEILKTDLLKYKQENRANIHNNRYSNKVLKLQTEVVYIPNTELTRN